MKLSKTGDIVDKKELFAGSYEEITMAINLEGQAHIMNLLTDLYENPIEATVRETVSNAIDAVIAAGSGEVYIYTPTQLAPYLTVQDTGTGMSYDVIQNVYAMYGASTKADNFNQIGAFGLGAKAPLSYCSEFTVKTTSNGETIELALTKSKDSNKIEIYNNKETDESNGTTVIIPVKEEDVEIFDNVVNRYKMVPDLPVDLYINDEKIVGNDNYTLIDESFTLIEESDTAGRIWVHNNGAERLLTKGGTSWGWESERVNFLLSGWLYSPEGNSNVIVEIKPGVLNFSSSRDEVTKDDRYRHFTEKIEEHIPQLQLNLLERMKHNTHEENKEIFDELYKIEYEKVTSDGWGSERALTKPKLNAAPELHDEIYNMRTSDGICIKEIMEDAEKNTYGTYEVERHGYRVHPTQVIGEVQYSRQCSIAELLEYIDTRIENDHKYNINLHFLKDAPTLVIGNINKETFKRFKNLRKYIQDTYNTNKVVLTSMSAKEAEASVYEPLKDGTITTYLNIDEINKPKKKTTKKKEKRISEVCGTLVQINKSNEDYICMTVDKLIKDEIPVILYSHAVDIGEIINGFVRKFYTEKEYNENLNKNVFIVSKYESKRLFAKDIRALDDAGLAYVDTTRYSDFRKSKAIDKVIEEKSFVEEIHNVYEPGLYEKLVKVYSLKDFYGLRDIIVIGKDEDYTYPTEYFDTSLLRGVPFEIKEEDLVSFTDDEAKLINDTITDRNIYFASRNNDTELSNYITDKYLSDVDKITKMLNKKGFKF